MYSLTMAPPTARVYARIPMDLRDTPEEETFRLEVRAWLEANAPKPPHPARGSDGSFEFGREWHRKLYDAGYAGMSWPPEHGGRGASPALQVIFEAGLGRAEAPGLSNHLGIFHVAPAIMAFGTIAGATWKIPRWFDSPG